MQPMSNPPLPIALLGLLLQNTTGSTVAVCIQRSGHHLTGRGLISALFWVGEGGATLVEHSGDSVQEDSGECLALNLTPIPPSLGFLLRTENYWERPRGQHFAATSPFRCSGSEPAFRRHNAAH